MADYSRYPTAHAISGVRHDGQWVDLTWSDGRRQRVHALWLRDNCPCPLCRHPQAMERMYHFVDAARPVVESCQVDSNGDLEVAFLQSGERHVSRFASGWLRSNDPAEEAVRQEAIVPRRWGADIARRLERIPYEDFMQSRSALRQWIVALKVTGIVLLKGVPQQSGHLLQVAGRIGPVRASNFGQFYDVVSMPNPNASAYTSMGLELHTDLANWRSPPDIQMLFCLKSTVIGGDSVFADGFQAAQALQREDPAAFDLLTAQPIEYRFHDATCDIRTSGPVIEVDRSGALRRIRFNNWLRGSTLLPPDRIVPMYDALEKFWRTLRDPQHQLRLKLDAGDLIAYDNSRILHGRTSFDTSSGERHLQGCYLNEEDLDSTMRLLDRAE